MPGSETVTDKGLGDYAAAVWRRKWTVVLTAILAVVVAVGLDMSKTKMYTSTVQVLLTVPGSAAGSSASSNAASQPNVATDIELMQSAAVKSSVAHAVGSVPTVAISEVGTTNVVQIAATSASPVAAAQIANAYANAYLAVSKSDYLGSINGQITQLQTQINSLQTTVNQINQQLANSSGSNTSSLQAQLTSALSQQQLLKTQLLGLQQSSASASGGQIVDPATPSAVPSSPKTLEDALFALGIGLLIGIGIALLRDFLDDRIRNREDLELAADGTTMIGLIPDVVTWKDRKTPLLISELRPNAPAAEAYRSLRTAVQFMSIERPIKLIQITSPAAADGKTTTSANLAVAMARAGQRVVLVACDLRKPRLHEFFGLPNIRGFTTVLLGDAEVNDVLIPVPEEDGLLLLPSGPIPPNPSELLSGARTRALFTQLASDFDVVVIDTSPILPVTDASVLATFTDAVILVAAANTSTKRDIRRAIELLSRVDANIVGTVLNRASQTDSYAYYRYGYGHGPDEPARTNGNGASSIRAAVPLVQTNGSAAQDGISEVARRRARHAR